MKVTDNIQKASDASSLVQKAWSSGLNTAADAGAEGLQIYCYWCRGSPNILNGGSAYE